MTTAFQSNAFQNNAFQIDVSPPTPTPTDTHDPYLRKIHLPEYQFTKKKKAKTLPIDEPIIEEILAAVEEQPYLPPTAIEWDMSAIEAYAKELEMSVTRIEQAIEQKRMQIKYEEELENDFISLVSMAIH